MKDWKLIGTACMLFLGCAACTRRTETRDDVPAVRLAAVETAGGDVSLRYPGCVRAAQDVALSFRVSGVLSHILVKEGECVSEGQLLAELDPSDYETQLTAAEAEYRQVKAEAERVMALYSDSGTTANAYDKAMYGLKQIEAKYKHAKDELAYTRLYAPFSAEVQSRLFDDYETVAAGAPVLTLIGGGAPEVELNLPASEYVRREAFSAYSCTFDIYPGIVYPLRPVAVAPQANANQLYTMRLQLLADGLPKPSPGMNTMVTIHCQASEEASCTVPTSAIKRAGDACSLFLFNAKDSTVRSLDIKVLKLLGDGRSIVASSSLKAGDSVVTSGIHHIADGEKVRPMASSGSTNVGGLL